MLIGLMAMNTFDIGSVVSDDVTSFRVYVGGKL